MSRSPLVVSREGRDTLWLLAMLALSMLPHAARLPLWCSVGAAGALAWRAQLAWRDGPLPRRWVLLAALVAAIALTFATHKALFGREAGITLVVVLSGLKTLELRARRDAFVVTSLAFFLILTQFLYSQAIGLAIAMLLVVWGLLASLVLAQRPLGRPPLRQALSEAGRALLLGAPLMVVLFLLFPRIGPLWSLPSDARGRSGLSDTLTLGRVAELALDDGIAMRIRFEGPPPPPRKLYFRGPVLDVFDGLTWRPHPWRGLDEDDEPVQVQGRPVAYQVTLEAPRSRNIPLLEATLRARTPPQQGPLTMASRALSWSSAQPLNDRIQLDAQAWTDFRQGPLQPTPALASLVQLPRGFNPRTLAWARALKSAPVYANAPPRVLAEAVLSYIHRQNFRYTLAPGVEQGEPSLHQIDRFWVDERAGFCEHFATAFVVVMRAMGVPSRVVTGYQGAELNPIDGLYVVRHSHAHAWAEYWQAGEGWIHADPTAAVAPERVDRSRPLQRPGDNIAGRLLPPDSPFVSRARALLEATNHRWNVWVLQYSRGSQTQLLQRLGWDVNDWGDIARALSTALSVITLVGVGWLWFSRERPPLRPWQAPMWRVHRALEKAGIPSPPHVAAPGSALGWLASIEALMAKHQPPPPALLHCAEALRQLDCLRYGPSSPGHALSPRAVARATASYIAAIEEGARQWSTRQGAASATSR